MKDPTSRKYLPGLTVVQCLTASLTSEDLLALQVPNSDPFVRIRLKLIRIDRSGARSSDYDGVIATFIDGEWRLNKGQRPPNCVNGGATLDKAVAIAAKRLFKTLTSQ